jgi:uroporphyrinogen III methyltransferase/synthase
MQPGVYLVGAGPGDPGLITVAGAEALRHADVVVYDFLANSELLKLCRPEAERVYVGKSGSSHTKTQDEINQLLVDKARSDGVRVVVRLKGGDPYVFGRGGEEAEFLRERGVRFVVIPGITSGIAAAAYAGVPVTHRELTSTVTLVTGHEREEAESPRVDYEALAKLARAGGTLVFYMGVKSLPVIVERLTVGGVDRETPAAVVRWGTHPKQQTVVGTLATIAADVARVGLTAPAITIVGRVVSLRQTLNWFEQRPLFGQRVLVTRTRQQASDLSAQLTELGAEVIEVPTIELAAPESWEEIDQKLLQMPAYDWIVFTSANGVRAAWDRLRHLTFDARHFGASNVAAIGAATAKALEEIGIVPDLLPEKFVGEELAAALREHLGDAEIRHQRFLLLRADIARPTLREELEKLGAQVEDVAIYRTQRPESLSADILQAMDDTRIDWVTFTSASTATNLWELLTPERRAKVGGMKRVSIGPVTSAALNGLASWEPTIEAKRHDIAGVVEALRNYVASAGSVHGAS